MDYYEISATEAQSYIDGLVALNDGTFGSGDKEKILEAIITQKWMAVFPNGNEGWAEFRRTDYPKLMLPLNNASGGDVRRWFYLIQRTQIRRLQKVICLQRTHRADASGGMCRTMFLQTLVTAVHSSAFVDKT